METYVSRGIKQTNEVIGKRITHACVGPIQMYVCSTYLKGDMPNVNMWFKQF